MLPIQILTAIANMIYQAVDSADPPVRDDEQRQLLLLGQSSYGLAKTLMLIKPQKIVGLASAAFGPDDRHQRALVLRRPTPDTRQDHDQRTPSFPG